MYFPTGPAAERYRAERRTEGNGVYMHIIETQDRGVCHIHTAALAREPAHRPIQWGWAAVTCIDVTGEDFATAPSAAEAARQRRSRRWGWADLAHPRQRAFSEGRERKRELDSVSAEEARQRPTGARFLRAK